MLIEFRVGNFFSFKEPVTFSMVARKAHHDHEAENTFLPYEGAKERLLRSVGVYGANAGGKTNLWRALFFMRRMVLESLSTLDSESDYRQFIHPFKLSKEMEGKPSFFEITVLGKSDIYRYGFEVGHDGIHSEWLFATSKETNRERTLFTRQGDEFEKGASFPDDPGGRIYKEKTRNEALYLSVCSQWNGKVSKSVVRVLKGMHTIGQKNTPELLPITMTLLNQSKTRKQVMDLIQASDPLLMDVLRIDGNDSFREGGDITGSLFGVYPCLDRKKEVQADVHKDEILIPLTMMADGTQKMLHLAGAILFGLANGYVLVVDELECRLHPRLTLALLALFHNEKTNPHNAQLIFMTHDTNLLQFGNLRRDQIWFAEKDPEGATDLYSLADMRDLNPDGTMKKSAPFVRKGEDLRTNYLRGRYGAIPFIGDFSGLFSSPSSDSKGES